VNLELFLISESASLREALARIEANHHGVALMTDHSGAVVGLATDGDIRRMLLKGASLDDPISCCANREFLWADQATPRESLLKQLDHWIRVIPILDAQRRLIDIVSRDRLPISAEMPVYSRARSPVRISFGGGGSDLTHFFVNDSGAVINATISLYSHATLKVRQDEHIAILSRDLRDELRADNLETVFSPSPRFGLIQSVLKTIRPDFGFDLFLHSDFPMNSGLGGSAVVSAAILGCFNELRHDKWDAHELAELAYQAERIYLGVAGGWQDQYATVFGGLTFMEFRMEQNLVHPLRIHPDTLLELEESLILCGTGMAHDSGEIHEHQRLQMQDRDIQRQVQAGVALTYRIRDHLLRGRLLQFGQALHEAWQLKRQFSEKISNAWLDALYDNALRHGAVGGKLLGAGGGGFFLFYVPPFRKYGLIDFLETSGLTVHPFRFDHEGLRTWTTRENRNYSEAEAS